MNEFPKFNFKQFEAKNLAPPTFGILDTSGVVNADIEKNHTIQLSDSSANNNADDINCLFPICHAFSSVRGIDKEHYFLR